ncbi:hypothetical protein BU16DRAFT_221619 [Lophium mytilinum]|uniref:F-box domain-containing protein n=1 Tax=Lophium mytilinum TaxID=390894 RepID=A0A6A6Q9H2_9PEZI|nr:hypothetical protein BU16DRAFT_221619 [Lophium mytilinum]
MDPAMPMNPETVSPFLRLPGELRNSIYNLALTTPFPITDPGVSSHHTSTPPLGLALLRTCHTIYAEASLRPLFALNRFHFTAVTHAHLFLSKLTPANRAFIQDVEVDVRSVHAQYRDWPAYLESNLGEVGKLASLRTDASGLKVLRLNFSAWPTIGLSRAELGQLLRHLVVGVAGLGLERVVLMGASRGETMARRNPWSPVHFVGAEDFGARFDLVSAMGRAVRDERDEKVVRWTRGEGAIELEVVLLSHIRRTNRSWAAPPVTKPMSEAWPRSGSCSWEEYQKRDSESFSSLPSRR